MRARDAVLAGLILLGAAVPAAAQKQPPRPAQQAKSEEEPQLKFEREFFSYPTTQRRDPFRSLAKRTGLGPRFEELVLKGIIYSEEAPSVALLADGAGHIYRVRRGDRVGNARVLEIRELRVLFAVEDFGVIHQDQLELKRTVVAEVQG
ncbi:MAG TPA: hypothetical protein VF188_18100 [Longimicrobiales bacterium]